VVQIKKITSVLLLVILDLVLGIFKIRKIS
jgi:hypothetical protein